MDMKKYIMIFILLVMFSLNVVFADDSVYCSGDGYSRAYNIANAYITLCKDDTVGTNLTFNNQPSNCNWTQAFTLSGSGNYEVNVSSLLLETELALETENYDYVWWHVWHYDTDEMADFKGKDESPSDKSQITRICFNASVDIYYTSINIDQPENTTYTNNNQVWLNFTPINNGLTTFPCYYYFNDVEYSLGNVTNNTLSSTTGFNLQPFNNIYVKCMNSDSTYTQTEKIYFSLDVAPTAKIVNLQTDYTYNNSVIEFQIMANDTEDSSLTCYYQLDDASYPSFSTLNNTIQVKTIGGVTNGEHSLLLNCTDSFGSSGIDIYNFTIDSGNLRVCFYTYADYAKTYISNNSIFWEGRQLTPDAMRDIVIFNDTLGKVWLVQTFTGLEDNYFCRNLVDGCVDFNLTSTSTYRMYIADNVDFKEDCYPLLSQPRYYEYAGEIYFSSGQNKTYNKFLDFEKDTYVATRANPYADFPQYILAISLFGGLFVAISIGKDMGSPSAIIIIWGAISALLWYFQSLLMGMVLK